MLFVSSRRILGILVLFPALLTHAQPPTPSPVPDLVLHGTLTHTQMNTYVENAFQVPKGTYRVTLTLSYTDKDQKTTLDLGIIDPHGVRCWSGGNKATLTMSATSATPSCLVGPVEAGTWKLLLGVPNLRPDVTSTYTAEVYFTKTGLVADEPAVLRKPLRTGAAWYRGDLHMHTAHSDGSCKSSTGADVPCPLFLTVDAAARRGLDFIAISDHNATSHYAPMRELAPYFDTLLLIPGREITTFHGHANLYGTEDFLDFRLGSDGVPDSNTMFRRAAALGGILSLNHPNAPTAEFCMGCGWSPDPPTDLHLVTAIEVVNAGAEEGPRSGLGFWEHALNQGFHITAVGGSDNHNATRKLDKIGSIGSPTTVVYANELSTPAILAAIRAGHVFIDLQADPPAPAMTLRNVNPATATATTMTLPGNTGTTAAAPSSRGTAIPATVNPRFLTLTATTADGKTAGMGDALTAPANTPVQFAIWVANVPDARFVVIEDGAPLNGMAPQTLTLPEDTHHLTWQSDGARHWFRVDVRSRTTDKLLLLGNPVYLNSAPTSSLPPKTTTTQTSSSH